MSDLFEFTAHNLRTGVTIAVPTGASELHLQSDIDIAPGSERLLFPATIGDTAGIYNHWLNTGVTDLLLAGAYDAVRADGTRLATRAGRHLRMAPLSNPAAATELVDGGSLYAVKDGLIGFGSDAGPAVAIHDGSTTIPLAEFGSWDTNAIADGYVVFNDSGRVHAWSPASGKHLVLDATVPTLHTQGVIYLLTGRSPGALYRTTLP